MNRADEIQKIVEDNEFMGGICLDREHYILVKPKIVAQALLSSEEARMKPLRDILKEMKKNADGDPNEGIYTEDYIERLEQTLGVE